MVGTAHFLDTPLLAIVVTNRNSVFTRHKDPELSDGFLVLSGFDPRKSLSHECRIKDCA